MLKNIKLKIQKVLVPLSIIAINTNVAFANDEVTRKMNRAKTWTLGILTTGAVINLIWAIFKAGKAVHQSDIEKAEKNRTNAIVAVVGISVADILIALWNSW